MHVKPRLARALGAIVVLAWFSEFARTESTQPARGARVLITQNIDEARLVTLRGNLRPEAIAANDRGEVPEDFPMLTSAAPTATPARIGKRASAVH
jgi:hypothetical protein